MNQFRRKNWERGGSHPLSRDARSFLVQYTQTGKNIPNYHKIYQMIIKYI
jgi:hypothetical protein